MKSRLRFTKASIQVTRIQTNPTNWIAATNSRLTANWPSLRALSIRRFDGFSVRSPCSGI